MLSTSASNPIDTVRQIPAIAERLENANHVDVKTIDGEQNLREFIVGFVNYNPAWIKFLYRVRMVFVRFLGMKQEGIPQSTHLQPEDLSFTAGDKLAFFDVIDAQEDHYYMAGATESHLTGLLAIAVEPLANGKNRFYVTTIVHYHRWTGWVYFNVIRPFHHVVVGQMMKSGIRD